jgi:uncharacterized protein (TIGR02145 family)
MAITSITISQDNIFNDSDLLPIHSPLIFIVDVVYTGTAPDTLKVGIYEDSALIETYKCIPYVDLTSTLRQFMFIADEPIRCLMGGFDDFLQVTDTLEYVEDITKVLTLRFYDPSTPATYDEMTATFIHGVAQFGERPNLYNVFENVSDIYYGLGNAFTYIYFYLKTLNDIVSINEANVQSIKYGRLYGWDIVNNAAFAPDGWHVPTKDEYDTLVTEIGGEVGNGIKLKESGLAYWLTPNTGATNELSFNARGSTLRDSDGTWGEPFKFCCYLWTNTFVDSAPYYNSYLTTLFYNSDDVVSGADRDKLSGLAVRLVKDTSDYTPGETLTDYDGNVYRTCKIGDQVWLADNWACTHLNDGTPIALAESDEDWAGSYGDAYCNYNNDIENVFENSSGQYVDKIGYYRLKSLVSGNSQVDLYLNGILEASKNIVSINDCSDSLIVKYLDRNGQYRFFPFNRVHKITDAPVQIGTTNKILKNILTDKSSTRNVGYKNGRQINAFADVSEEQLLKLSDIYTSPRVYLYIGTGNDLDNDWLEIIIKANENTIKRAKGGSGSIDFTILMPERYTVTML